MREQYGYKKERILPIIIGIKKNIMGQVILKYHSEIKCFSKAMQKHVPYTHYWK